MDVVEVTTVESVTLVEMLVLVLVVVTVLVIVGLLWATGAPSVDPALVPAWEALGAIRGREGPEVGEMNRRGAAGSVAAIIVHPLSAAPVGWDPIARRIVIDEQLLGEEMRSSSPPRSSTG
jgi:hypothetical protein